MGKYPVHEQPREPCALHRREMLMRPWGSTPSRSMREHPARSAGSHCSWAQRRPPPPTSNRTHPVRCTSRTRSWTHGGAQQPRAYTSIPRATLVEIAHGPRGEHPAHEQPQIILCAAQVGSTYGPMGEHRIRQHTRASCTLHKLETQMGPWESAPSSSIHEHPVRYPIYEKPRAPCALHR